MTRNEKIREILENAKSNNRKVTLIGKDFQLNCEICYIYILKDKVTVITEDVIYTTIPFDNITSVI